MSENTTSRASSLLGYVIYGMATCAVLLVPWLVLEEVFKRLPAGSVLKDKLRSLELPAALEVVLGLVVLVVALALIGWLVRRFFWDRLSSLPVFRIFMPSVEKLSDQLKGGGKRPDVVAWVMWPNENMHTLGIVKGRGAAEQVGSIRVEAPLGLELVWARREDEAVASGHQRRDRPFRDEGVGEQCEDVLTQARVRVAEPEVVELHAWEHRLRRQPRLRPARERPRLVPIDAVDGVRRVPFHPPIAPQRSRAVRLRAPFATRVVTRPVLRDCHLCS